MEDINKEEIIKDLKEIRNYVDLLTVNDEYTVGKIREILNALTYLLESGPLYKPNTREWTLLNLSLIEPISTYEIIQHKILQFWLEFYIEVL